jgi:hypothetical protein
VRPVGKTLILVGAVVYLVALAGLHWAGTTTHWNEETLAPAILSGIAVVAAVLAVVAFASDSVFLPALALSLSFLLLGLSMYLGEGFSYSYLGPGYWIANAAALVMSVGGLFALSGYTVRDGRGVAPAPAAPAAGWYDDPSGLAQQRYWTGAAWSEEAR